MTAPVWARAVDGGWELALRVQPRARTTEVVGEHGDALKIRVAAPADDGKANAGLIKFLAATLGIPTAAVVIVRGEHHRSKIVHVTGDVEIARLVG